MHNVRGHKGFITDADFSYLDTKILISGIKLTKII